ncbi:F0F1 ATP synthase subunit A [Burkholderia pseudomallei]|uniref:F0F1 ATP synthase subunit A n=1 Tax=Burkholderia pseudomallei TaxID=28450 RepID=UPI0019228BFA|nr:F0F1 ATP synthase subunit A [Burkholderia pseudomallei]
MWETARASFDGIAAAIGLALGFAAGACHFVSLGWNSRLFVAGRAGVALALQLARVALAATLYYGVRARGVRGYLATFAEPTWVMIPLNVVEQLTRTFSLIVRLFGNVMSGVFVIGIVLSLAGLFVPIPLMALDLLTGTVQAYIFMVLSMVFIGAAVSGDETSAPRRGQENT